MVKLITYMVATTAMAMGIQALDAMDVNEELLDTAQDFELVHSVSVVANPASVVEPTANSASVHADVHGQGIIEDIGNFLGSIFNPLPLIPIFGFPSSNDDKINKAPALVPIPHPTPVESIAHEPAVSSAVSSAVKVPSSSISHVEPSLSLSHAEHSLSLSQSSSSASSSIAFKLKNKRAIYDMNGSYAESAALLAVPALSNVYSAQDEVIQSAAPSVSASAIHFNSVKAVLRARGFAKSAYSAYMASVSQASVSAAHEYASLDAEEPAISQAAIFDIGEIILSNIAKEIRSSIGNAIGSAIIEHSSELIEGAKSIISNFLPPPPTSEESSEAAELASEISEEVSKIESSVFVEVSVAVSSKSKEIEDAVDEIKDFFSKIPIPTSIPAVPAAESSAKISLPALPSKPSISLPVLPPKPTISLLPF